MSTEPADSPASTVEPALAKAVLDRVAPPMPTPRSYDDEVRRSPVYRLPVLCNGESTAARDAEGLPVDGTGHVCVHYWAFRRIPEAQNVSDIKLGETTRYCRAWVGGGEEPGPMEFGEGRELMANCCNLYEPDTKPHRTYCAALEQKPPVGEVEVIEPPKPEPFDPGLPKDRDYVWPLVFARRPEDLFVVKQTDAHRWCVHGGDEGMPLFLVYFRCAFDQEEYAEDVRFPKGDIRRYARDKIAALELCLEKEPLVEEDVRGHAGGGWTDANWQTQLWQCVLNRPRQTVNINDALGA